MKIVRGTRLNQRLLKVFTIITASLIIMGGLIGCNTGSDEPPLTTEPAVYPMTVTDDAGRVVTIATKPTKIISLVPSHTEIAYALGLGDKIVGVDANSDYPEAVLTLPKVGDYFGLNLEQIVALEPDLVLVDISAVGKGDVTALTNSLRTNGKVLVVKGTSISNFQEVYDSIAFIGKVTDSDSQAEEIISNMKTRVKAITDKTDTLTINDKPRTAYIIFPPPFLFTHSGNSLGSVLIEAAGGVNIFKDVTGDAISLESLIGLNPQVLIGSADPIYGDDTYQFVLTHPDLATTSARIDGKVFPMNDTFTGRPGPRLVEGLEQMAKLLHPELFS